MVSKLSPPYMETVQKYVKDTGDDIAAVQAKIADLAKKMRTKNLDVAAWSWVQSMGKAPPALNIGSPFTSIDKPYLTIAEAIGPDSKVGEATGFPLRGYFFTSVERTDKEGKARLIATIGDESGVTEITYFGKQVEAVRALGLKSLDPIFISSAQVGTYKDKKSIKVSGNYTETKKIAPADKNLPPISQVGARPINSILTWDAAMIKASAFDTSDRTYTGCSKCNTKFKENVPLGHDGECLGNPEKNRPGCGRSPAKEFTWTTIRVNDDEGEIACSFSPDFEFEKGFAESLKGEYLNIVGRLNDRGDFNVIWFARDLPETTTPPTPPATTVVTILTPSNPPVITASASIPVMSSIPPTEAIAPLLNRWLKLCQPASEDKIFKFTSTKKISAEATKAALSEMLELGMLVREPTGEIRLP